MQILIIEDNDFDCELIKKVLAKSLFDGFEIIRFYSYLEYHRANIKRPSVIILDLQDGKNNETTKIKKMLDEQHETPVIILTTNEDENQAEELISLGASDYVYKREALSLSSTLLARSIKHSIARKKYQLSIEEVSKFKTSFLANMSHEIRTPLNVICGVSEIIKVHPSCTDIKNYSTILENSATSLLSLINNIIDLSKVEAGELNFINEEFHLMNVIEETISMFGLLAHKQGIELRYEPEGSLPCLICLDEQRFRQILINLIGNAVKFTSQGNVSLCINFNEDLNQIIIKISDTGIGIERSKLKTVFDEFKQANNYVSKNYEGTGLGLAITQKLVTALEGTINLESEYGIGTSVTVTLPTGMERKSIVIEEFNGIEKWNGKNILFISENKNDIRVISSFLSKADATIDTCNNESDAASKIFNQNQKYDLIFISVRMSRLGGIETYYKLKERGTIKSDIVLIFPPSNRHSDVAAVKEIKPLASLHEPITFSSLMTVFDSSRKEVKIKQKAGDSPEEVTTHRPKSILLVEDFPENRLVVKEFLKSIDVNIIEAENGQDALDKLKKDEFDLILMDLQMPIMDGFTAVRFLRKEEESGIIKRRKVIALTANALQEDRDSCLNLGFDDYVSKPIKKNDFISLVMKYLDNSHGLKFNLDFKKEEVDSDFKDYMPTYLNNRRDDYKKCLLATNSGNLKEVSSICHKILGSARTYGLKILDGVIENMQESAKRDDLEETKRKLDNFKHYLDSAS